MTKREYLRQYQLIEQEIQRILRERNDWEDLALRLTLLLEGEGAVEGHGAWEFTRGLLPLGRRGTQVEELENGITSWERRLMGRAQRLLRLRWAIDDAIQALPDPELQLMLQYRYVDGMTLEEIAEKMHYCQRHVSRLHEAALNQLCIPGCMEEADGERRGRGAVAN